MAPPKKTKSLTKTKSGGLFSGFLGMFLIADCNSELSERPIASENIRKQSLRSMDRFTYRLSRLGGMSWDTAQPDSNTWQQ
jgi:hypothetical protein